ncbi:hypothetical protein [Streptomyces sp. NPDC001530]|uniref:hypothetical protein n=1 Tax=Streptomyces sp. NPDC001530 TaxID=3364582 RepID=UPI003687ED3F
MRVLVDVVVVASAVSALAITPRVLARRPGPPAAAAGRSVSPAAAPALVTGLVYVNQVLFTVYVLRVHDGDPSFISRYLPAGWFDLASANPALRTLAAHFPAPELLAPSVLRVTAFLELPFVLLAFATVVRWLDADLYRRIARSALPPSASVSYTAVFCLVEWDLRNPYTVDDLVIRAVSAVVTPVLLARLAGRDTATSRVRPPRRACWCSSAHWGRSARWCWSPTAPRCCTNCAAWTTGCRSRRQRWWCRPGCVPGDRRRHSDAVLRGARPAPLADGVLRAGPGDPLRAPLRHSPDGPGRRSVTAVVACVGAAREASPGRPARPGGAHRCVVLAGAAAVAVRLDPTVVPGGRPPVGHGRLPGDRRRGVWPPRPKPERVSR